MTSTKSQNRKVALHSMDIHQDTDAPDYASLAAIGGDGLSFDIEPRNKPLGRATQAQTIGASLTDKASEHRR